MLKQKLKQKAFAIITKIMGDKDSCVLLPVLTGPAKGLRFRLELETRFESAYFLGRYELPTLRRLVEICQEGWVIWDCGTYLGFFTAFFGRLVGPAGRVVAFEPDPRNMVRTQENVKLNKLSNVQFVQAAIGAPIGETDFILSDNTNSHIPGVYVGASMKDYKLIERRDALTRVRCLSFDQAYLDHHIPSPTLIKVDIDGAEKEALKHGSKLFTKIRPLIILELHNPECDVAAWEFAQKMDYSLQSLSDGRVLQKIEEVSGTLLCIPR